MRSAALLKAVLFATIVAPSDTVLACAAVGRDGASVRILDESAIIVWDAPNRTQHFIRRASFETGAASLGFLVPTPSAPELEQADDGAFKAAIDLTAARTKYVDRPVSRDEYLRRTTVVAQAAASADRGRVVVLATKAVAGYDAAVLRADDPSAMNRWLKTNGYPSSPQLEAWLAPYVEKRWIITAFKIASESGQRAEGGAVRMSFRTDRPYFPYREPEAAHGAERGKSRALRLYVLAAERVDGRVGSSPLWPGQTLWSDTIAATDLANLLRLVKLPDTTAPGALRLTEFLDTSSPRPGTDELYFARAMADGILHRPTIKVDRFVIVPDDRKSSPEWVVAGSLLVGAIALLGWLAYRRARPTTPPA